MNARRTTSLSLRSKREVVLAAATLSENTCSPHDLVRVLFLAYERGARRVEVQELQADDPRAAAWRVDQILREPLLYRDAAPLRRLTFLGGSGEVGDALLRPGSHSSLLEANLRPPPHTDHFVTCADEDGFVPFLCSHDGEPRCGHMALWTLTRTLARRFDDVSVLDPQAVEQLRHPARRGRGLLARELHAVLERANYRVASDVFVTSASHRRLRRMKPGQAAPVRTARPSTKREDSRADEIVYRYVESGLPALVVLSPPSATPAEHLHALVVVGHSFDPEAWWAYTRPPPLWRRRGERPAQDHLPSSAWAKEYVCHDDAVGPYVNVTRGTLRTRAEHMFVAIPRSLEIDVLPGDAEARASQMVRDLARGNFGDEESAPLAFTRATLRPACDEQKLVLRTVLVERTMLLAHLRRRQPRLATALDRLDPFPPRVWMVEVSTAPLFGVGLKLGEVLLDPRTQDHVLAIHLPGFLYLVGGTPDFAPTATVVPVFHRPDTSARG